MSTKQLAIVIPAFNEAVGIQKCAVKVIKTISKIDAAMQLIIVDDGSSDATFTLAREVTQKYPGKLVVLQHKRNQGYGAALQTGARHAAKLGFKYVLFMDSDLTNDPKFIPDFYAQIPNNYDCVKASRYIVGGRMDGVEPHRQLISKTGNLIASALFGMGIHDCTNGFRMVKVSKLRGLTLHERGFASILEELLFLKRQRATIIEIPTVLTARKKTQTHFVYNPATFWNYLKYALTAVLA